jgi:predicted nucleic acid-binding Zn ribbon protein
MANDDEYSDYNETRQRRVKIVAWVVIVSLILVGGGATVLALLFG